MESSDDDYNPAVWLECMRDGCDFCSDESNTRELLDQYNEASMYWSSWPERCDASCIVNRTLIKAKNRATRYGRALVKLQWRIKRLESEREFWRAEAGKAARFVCTQSALMAAYGQDLEGS